MRKSKTKLPIEVSEMQHIDLVGNIVPHVWFQRIGYYTPKADFTTDLLAVFVLADICYWYKPKAIINENTNRVIGYTKKFKSDMLQRDYQQIANMTGRSKSAARDAVNLLEVHGLIRKEFRPVVTGKTVLANVLFLAPITSVVKIYTAFDFDVNKIAYIEKIGRKMVRCKQNCQHPPNKIVKTLPTKLLRQSQQNCKDITENTNRDYNTEISTESVKENVHTQKKVDSLKVDSNQVKARKNKPSFVAASTKHLVKGLDTQIESFVAGFSSEFKELYKSFALARKAPLKKILNELRLFAQVDKITALEWLKMAESNDWNNAIFPDKLRKYKENQGERKQDAVEKYENETPEQKLKNAFDLAQEM